MGEKGKNEPPERIRKGGRWEGNTIAGDWWNFFPIKKTSCTGGKRKGRESKKWGAWGGTRDSVLSS